MVIVSPLSVGLFPFQMALTWLIHGGDPKYLPVLGWSSVTAFQLTNHHLLKISTALRLLTPPMETPDPPNDIPGALKQVVLTPHDIPWSLRVVFFDGTGNLKVLLSLGISMFWPNHVGSRLFSKVLWAFIGHPPWFCRKITWKVRQMLRLKNMLLREIVEAYYSRSCLEGRKKSYDQGRPCSLGEPPSHLWLFGDKYSGYLGRSHKKHKEKIKKKCIKMKHAFETLIYWPFMELLTDDLKSRFYFHGFSISHPQEARSKHKTWSFDVTWMLHDVRM